MLAELRIRNLAVIEEASLSFGPGLNVLSGETGAGKTIVMNALGLLLGARASAEVVRPGAGETVVEGLFALDADLPQALSALLAEREGRRELLVRRIVAADGGRSRILLDGELATAQTLFRLGAELVEVYGQHEQHSLLRAENHREVLDQWAGLDPLVRQYQALYRRAGDLQSRLTALQMRERERAELLELSRFRLAELQGADPKPGEDEQLSQLRAVLANATRLSEAANEAYAALYGGDNSALDLTARAGAKIAEAARLDPRMAAVVEMLKTARVGIEESALALKRYLDELEVDPDRLEQVEVRLATLAQLKRKYGGSLEAVLAAREKAQSQLRELEETSEQAANAQAELECCLEELGKLADRLSTERRAHAAAFRRKLESELRALGMRSPTVEPRLTALEPAGAGFLHQATALGPGGADKVEFYLAANAGQPPMALAKVASGGELSRIMLALKGLQAARRGVSTLVFDEVDAGVGGAAAEAVGRKLKSLARFHQVLCVTHLAQVAAFADSHFRVEKIERRGVTRSLVQALAPAEREQELARMLGGAQITERIRAAAGELLSRAASLADG
jgi:DNA repair protein RecN (Recombination protein N)